MSTPVSGTTPYCSAEEFLVFVDFRTIVDLCSDDNGRPLESDFTDDTTRTGQIALAVLQASSGELESAVLLGGRYTVENLGELTGNQAQFIKKLVADLSLWEFYCRRPDLMSQMPAKCEQAKAIINAIAQGEMIFGIQENIDAGHLNLTVETPQDVINRNLVTFQAQRYFGRRANRSCRP